MPQLSHSNSPNDKQNNLRKNWSEHLRLFFKKVDEWNNHRPKNANLESVSMAEFCEMRIVPINWFRQYVNPENNEGLITVPSKNTDTKRKRNLTKEQREAEIKKQRLRRSKLTDDKKTGHE